ncbi:MAG TPA: dTDP-4-dehydrorhamnose 3,5-epimerase [Stellaceae bacterium]|nr:dTDP-4-dehydrorhamnose 3,5-epimerase [Stellaceae bacterium]
MQVSDTAISGVRLLVPTRHRDARGFFSEVYREDTLAAHGIAVRFVQDNHSLSLRRGTVRGLHFQIPPFAQAKLVWVTAGAVFDVAVDLRLGSPSFGRYVAARLSAAEGNQLFVPEGFAHGFCTLEPDTEVTYKVSRPYSAAQDRGLYWNDPALAIPWPIAAAEALLSERDRKHPLLAELPAVFRYEPDGGRIE